MLPKILARNLTPKAAAGKAVFLRVLATLFLVSLSFLTVEAPSSRPSFSQSSSFPVPSRISVILRTVLRVKLIDVAAAPRYFW